MKGFAGSTILGLSLGLWLTAMAAAQPAPEGAADPDVPPVTGASATSRPTRHTLAYAWLRGKKVEDIRVMGNTQVSTPVILNVVRTRIGDSFDPDTVEEDYQRVYNLKKFGNVEAKAEPTATGVIVTFIVTEQKQVRSIAFKGNVHVETKTLQDAIDVREGEAIDSFRIALARQSIESLYRSKNYPYAHVEIDKDKLAAGGELVFNVVEGPNVRVRKIEFTGNHNTTDSELRGEIATKYWIWIFRAGTFDPDTVEDDVAAIKRFYRNKGFFDCRVGRKIVESPDQTQVKVVFMIDEGIRYFVDKVTFRGNASVSDAQLRQGLRLVEGRPFAADMLQRDVRAVVRAYSPLGFIYQPGSSDPDYLQIGSRMGEPVKTVFRSEPGKVELVYEIHEGKPFKLGRIIVKGNGRTQDKVVLREMRMAPGQKYNSAEVQDASDRLRGSGYFSNAVITPIGDDPNVRDVLVDVTEARTASFGVGAGINSNGGLGANISYEQRNFDITNWPDSWSDVFTDRAFIGAGQRFRVSLEPGTQATNASVLFSEPWLFDQPYTFTGELYYRDREREDWNETRAGGRATVGRRLQNIYVVSMTLRAEDVNVHNLGDDAEQCGIL